MRYLWQHIHFIIQNYDGTLPLVHFIKNYYKQQPKLGSRDRKIISNMAYSWYRAEKAVVPTNSAEVTIEQKLKACLATCGIEPNPILFSEVPDSSFSLNLNLLLPTIPAFSKGIGKEAWLQSILQQPDLFIRVREDKDKIINLLNEKKIQHHFITSNCISLPNGSKIDELLPPDIYVVQDASSQQTANYFNPKKNERWLDCCAGAGGKSILLKDTNAAIQLTVADVRESILHNLHERFRLYHHTQPVGKLADAADPQSLANAFGNQQFDNIICDAPCSGSGTWARTPEQLYFFKTETIKGFTDRQIKIATNISHYLKPGGRLLYITCSVFEQENEGVVQEIVSNTGLKLLESHLINGIDNHADSMFIAILGNHI